jgi:hypothetical protein
VAACAALSGVTSLFAQEHALPERMRTAQGHYTNVDPLAITLAQTAEGTEMARQNIAKKVVDAMVAVHSGFQQVAFREGRIYTRRQYKGHSSEERIFEVAFDRSVLYMGQPGTTAKKWKERPFLQKLLPKNDDPEGSYFSLPYFRAAGIRMPTRLKELVVDWRPQSELLALLREGGRVEAVGAAILDGRSLIRVRVLATDWKLKGIPVDLSALETQLRFQPHITEEEVQRRLSLARKLQDRRAPLRGHDFYLDPEHAYAVRRLEIRDEAGKLVTRANCTEHEKLNGRGVWLPRRCRVEEFTYGELLDEQTLIPRAFASPLFVYEFKVSSFRLEPWPNDKFQLNYTAPGTEVNDGTFPEVTTKIGVIYEIPADPERLDRVVDEARAKFQLALKPGKWSPRNLVLVVNFVLVVGVAIFYAVRRFVVKARKGRSA